MITYINMDIINICRCTSLQHKPSRSHQIRTKNIEVKQEEEKYSEGRGVMYGFTGWIYIKQNFNPITGRGGVNLTPPHSGLFKIALKPFELLTYKFFTFPKYEFNMFIKKCSSIDFFWVYISCTFWNARPNFPSCPHALHGTLVWISPLDRAPGHFDQGIIVIKP